MAIIPQQQLFGWEDIEGLGDLERLHGVVRVDHRSRGHEGLVDAHDLAIELVAEGRALAFLGPSELGDPSVHEGGLGDGSPDLDRLL